MSLAFTERMLAFIQDAAKTNEEGLQLIIEDYEKRWPSIPGAPDPKDTVFDDAHSIAAIGSFGEAEESWQSFKARIAAERQRELQAINPYNCRWYRKTEDDTNPWFEECGTLSEAGQVALFNVLSECSPKLDRPMRELLATINPVPDDQLESVKMVTESLIRMLPLFVWSMGGSDADWMWGPSVCLLAGLGFENFRRIARVLEREEYEGWDYWATCSDNALAEDIIKMQQTCGFPVGMLRCDFRTVYTVMQTQDIRKHGNPDERWVPRWFISLCALHILKHSRLVNVPGSSRPKIFAAYNGQCALLDIPESGYMQPLGSKANATLVNDLCRTLQLPYSTAGNREWFHEAAARAVNRMHPSMLPFPEPLTLRTDLIAAPQVVVEASRLPERGRKPWINPGISLTNIATIDEEGYVNSRAAVSGEDVLAFDWPLAGAAKPEDIAAWRTSLPRKVEPRRASDTLLGCLRNINDLGHRRGLAAIIDAVCTLDLFRPQLQGTNIGNSLRSEFPLLFALPMGGDLENTTNQGKTTLCRLLGKALVPSIDVTVTNASPSAPAQRSMALPIERDGTTILDEFRLPASTEHFLNHAGLQSLATGGKVSPGRAGENAEAFSLRHPLFLSAKVAPEVPDIVNRSVSFFLDVISKENTASDQELADIHSGKMGMVLRLCHLRWIEQTGIIDEIKKLHIARGTWRFNAHLAVANFFSEDEEAVDDYIEASQVRCREQVTRAGQTGLADEVGLKRSFDPEYYLSNVDDLTLYGLFSMNEGKKISPITFVRDVISDGDRRNIDRVLSQYNVRESSAVRKFTRAFEAIGGVREFGEFEVRYIDPTADEDCGLDPSDPEAKPYFTIQKALPDILDKAVEMCFADPGDVSPPELPSDWK